MPFRPSGISSQSCARAELGPTKIGAYDRVAAGEFGEVEWVAQILASLAR
jgi:hypothetical protein